MATIAVVAISGAIVRFVIVNNRPKEQPKTEEIRDNGQKVDDEESKLAEKKIDPTVTKTPEPTKEVKPTDTVKPTATVKPTEFVKNLNPTTNKETMENKICKVFGESDCQWIVVKARYWNKNLSSTFSMSMNKLSGLIPLSCNQALVRELSGLSTIDSCFNGLKSDPDLSISTAKKIFDQYGASMSMKYMVTP